MQEIPVGKARLISDGKDIAVLSIGHPGNFVVEAAEQLHQKGISVKHYDMRFANPLDEEVLHEVMKNFKKIITVEDGAIKGGFGSAVLEFAGDHGYAVKIKRMGIPDYFVEHGTQQELWHECGYDTDGIRTAIEEACGKELRACGQEHRSSRAGSKEQNLIMEPISPPKLEGVIRQLADGGGLII
ncbi:MAG: hypothetical protein MZV63_10710 [Marinilabiliales bacterium]|nr:hypothetical protein [Marinilabiliales bacterium]